MKTAKVIFLCMTLAFSVGAFSPANAAEDALKDYYLEYVPIHAKQLAKYLIAKKDTSSPVQHKMLDRMIADVKGKLDPELSAEVEKGPQEFLDRMKRGEDVFSVVNCMVMHDDPTDEYAKQCVQNKIDQFKKQYSEKEWAELEPVLMEIYHTKSASVLAHRKRMLEKLRDSASNPKIKELYEQQLVGLAAPKKHSH